MNKPVRKFEFVPAVRASVPLLVGLYGPSGGGKTFSALRLATGIQEVTGGAALRRPVHVQTLRI
jgi:ABC-type sulfate/molybdate transport systems ATPase subunit